jgi:hypothetical protein
MRERNSDVAFRVHCHDVLLGFSRRIALVIITFAFTLVYLEQTLCFIFSSSVEVLILPLSHVHKKDCDFLDQIQSKTYNTKSL